MSVNKVILIGNVGRDPEIRHLDSGVAVATFSLATSETYTAKNGERITNTEWHNIVLWRGLAEVAEKYVKKGMQLYVEGRIRNRSYDDKEGNKRYITEINGDVMRMLTSKSDQQSPSNYQKSEPDSAAPAKTESKGNATTYADEVDDDLPF